MENFFLIQLANMLPGLVALMIPIVGIICFTALKLNRQNQKGSNDGDYQQDMDKIFHLIESMNERMANLESIEYDREKNWDKKFENV